MSTMGTGWAGRTGGRRRIFMKRHTDYNRRVGQESGQYVVCLQSAKTEAILGTSIPHMP